MKRLATILLVVTGLLWTTAAPAAAQSAMPASSAAPAAVELPQAAEALDSLDEAADSPAGFDEGRMSTAVEIAVLLTVLSLLPAILITVTSFTRIVIVLSFVRRALSTNDLPPNPVIIGLALFLSTFVMAPVAQRVYADAWTPYHTGELTMQEAADTAWLDLSEFLVANTRKSELELFCDLAEYEPEGAGVGEPLPLQVVVPAFVLSELKTAFQMGFLLFLPFLVIDLVISSVLLSMGMFMLPPVMISTPFKILLFVLVDGWHLVCESLVTSFHVT